MEMRFFFSFLLFLFRCGRLKSFRNLHNDAFSAEYRQVGERTKEERVTQKRKKP